MFEKKHEMLRKLAREFAEKELASIADEAEKMGDIPKNCGKRQQNMDLAGLRFQRNTAEQAGITSPLQSW